MSERYEEGVEEALDYLREARAPLGMQMRVLAAVREHEIRGSSSRRFSVWIWGGVAAAVAVVVIAVGMLEVRHGSARVGVLPNLTARTGQMAGVPEKSAPAEAIAKPVVVPVSGGSHRVVRVAGVSRVKEMRSYPAPAEPLTQQELALVAIALSANKGEFAMLDPEQRAIKNAAEEAEFKRFVQRSY